MILLFLSSLSLFSLSLFPLDLVIGDIKSYIDILMKLSCNCLTLETNSSCSNITQLTQDITTKEKRVRSSDTKGRTDLVEPASSQNIDCHMLQLGLKRMYFQNSPLIVLVTCKCSCYFSSYGHQPIFENFPVL